MCERFALYGPISRHREHFRIPDDGFEFGPRYNLAPGQATPVVRSDENGNRSFLLALWGLIPACTKVTDTLQKPINAKAETAAILPMFRRAFRQSRVLVPADAFYEWNTVAGEKQPYLIHMKDEQPFGMGGLLEYWRGPAGDVATFAILTTSPNTLVAEIHNRMPVIIAAANYAEWLDPAVTDINQLHTLIGPYPEQFMEAYPVSKRVKNEGNESIELIGKLN